MKRNQKAETYNEKRRYKVYGMWCGKWEILAYTSELEKGMKKYDSWAEEDGAYTKAADMVLKLVDTKTNMVIKSQNC